VEKIRRGIKSVALRRDNQRVGDVVTCKLSEVYDQVSGDSHLSRGLFLPTDEDSLRRRPL
jgi:hypothetical protein